MTPEERIKHCHEYAVDLIKSFGYDDWVVKMDNLKVLGSCVYDKKEILLNLTHVVYDPMSQVYDTIKHEVAHMLTGPEAKAHGAEWKQNCKRVGAVPLASTPAVLSQETRKALFKYQAHIKSGDSLTPYGWYSNRRFDISDYHIPAIPESDGNLVWVKL